MSLKNRMFLAAIVSIGVVAQGAFARTADELFNLEDKIQADVKSHNYASALKQCNDWVASGETPARAISNRADVYEGMGQYQSALADVNKAIQLKPIAGAYYDQRGTIYGKMGDTSKALENWRLGLKYLEHPAGLPEGNWEHNNIGLLLAKQGNYAGAIDEYNLAIKANPGDPVDALYLRGCALQQQGRLKEALTDFLKCSVANNGMPAPFQRAAILYEKLGMTAEAKKSWQLASVQRSAQKSIFASSLLIPSGLSDSEIETLRGVYKNPFSSTLKTSASSKASHK